MVLMQGDIEGFGVFEKKNPKVVLRDLVFRGFYMIV